MYVKYFINQLEMQMVLSYILYIEINCTEYAKGKEIKDMYTT